MITIHPAGRRAVVRAAAIGVLVAARQSVPGFVGSGLTGRGWEAPYVRTAAGAGPALEESC